MRIALLQLGYETNTFMAGTSDLRNYLSGDWVPAEHADAIVTCDTPSIYPNDIRKIPYKNMPAGISPLEDC